MRWPMIDAPDGSEQLVDQETVNKLVDYAISQGVNYFDTSPGYLQGKSETVTGIALSRHPRESYYLATKMSNHSHAIIAGKKGKELYQASLDMYHHSFEAMQTDYFDYYLLHNVGTENKGLPYLMERFFDNDLIGFLLEERKAGRIRNLGFSYHGETKEVFEYLLSRHDEIQWDFVQLKMNYVDYRYPTGVDLTAEQLYNGLTKRNIPVIIMEPLLAGRLASLPGDWNTRLKQIRPNDSIASWAFRYAGSFPNAFTVLSGMTYMEHLQDNLRTYSPLTPCTDDELTLLEDVAQEIIRQRPVS
jgi:predicted aldo/keto reductase-like oxidoreductase